LCHHDGGGQDADDGHCRKLLPVHPIFFSFLSSYLAENEKRNRISIRRCASLSDGPPPFDPQLPSSSSSSSQDVVVLLILFFHFLGFFGSGI
jgi:hypothetical protein